MARVNTGSGWTALAPTLTDGTYTTVDTSTATQAKVQLAAEIGAQSVLLLGGGTKQFSVDYMSHAALAACTYANGTAGQGATLTGNANGALATMDGITPVANDTVFVAHQAAPLQNGVYIVTQVGDGSNPFILTRDVRVDNAPDWNNGISLYVAKGRLYGGRTCQFRGTTITVGTHGINFQPTSTLGDIQAGVTRDRQVRYEEFDGFTASQTGSATAAHIPGLSGYVAGSGTGNLASQIDGTAAGGEVTVQGCIQLETGTTTTGFCIYYTNPTGIAFDTSKRWELYCKPKIPTVSDGTETFNVKIGFGSSTSTDTDGIYLEARSGQTNWLAVTRAASTETTADTGIAYNTAFRSFSIDCPGDGHVYFCNAGSQIADMTATLPSAALLPMFKIVKSAGTTTRTLRVDIFASDMPGGANVLIP